MQVIAMGRWSKAEKQWKTVVTMRRPAAGKGTPATRGERDPRDRDEK